MRLKVVSKVAFVIALIIAVIGFSTKGFVYADKLSTSLTPANAKSCAITDIPQEELQESKTIKSKNGNKVYDVKNPEKYVKALGLEAPSPGAKLVGISFSYSNPAPNSTTNPSSDFTTQAGTGYYLKNIRSSEACGAQVIRSSYYTGPSTPTMTVTETVSASFNANVGVSAQVVSAGVGFNVTSTYTVSDSYSVKVPAGKTYNIRANPIFLIKNYEVWNDPWIGFDKKVGSGSAQKPIGVCFYYWEV
ncbi:hypothetical protein CU633_07205 [Bacillus sp. V3-13]|uniref:hypothetical protein n=1 Tax=Bacillus sp. V3-13 TaxID=2053728 RepID=UPI000C76E151|nr:hypothetical protein [Bacillus sp. V3-13]PLR78039.1 hypothetical protein CU633_07205 [Bacillus sp. V3-13]